jgi:hemerythrin
MFIRFDDSLETGQVDIDGHHRGLIDWSNELNDPRSNVVGAGKVREGMRFLARYVEFHFAAEERAMEGSGYPRLEAHRRAHTYFRRQVRALESELGPNNDPRTQALRMHMLMQDWFLQHIRNDDRDLAAWLRSHPVEEPEEKVEDSLQDFMEQAGIDMRALEDVRYGKGDRLPRKRRRRS